MKTHLRIQNARMSNLEIAHLDVAVDLYTAYLSAALTAQFVSRCDYCYVWEVLEKFLILAMIHLVLLYLNFATSRRCKLAIVHIESCHHSESRHRCLSPGIKARHLSMHSESSFLRTTLSQEKRDEEKTTATTPEN